MSSGKAIYDDPEFVKIYSVTERFTGIYGRQLLRQVGFDKVDPSTNLVILDLACGTGVVSAHLVDMLSEASKADLMLTCADNADGMVNYVTGRIKSCGWKGAQAIKVDGQDTKLPSNNYTHIVCNFGPAIFPDPVAGMKEMFRMLKAGGTVGVTSWKYVGWMDEFRTAFASNPELPPYPDTPTLMNTFSSTGDLWAQQEYVKEVLESTGFVDIEVHEVPQTTEFANIEEMLMVMPGALGIIFNNFWTEEQRKMYSEKATESVKKYFMNKNKEGNLSWNWVGIIATAKKAD